MRPFDLINEAQEKQKAGDADLADRLFREGIAAYQAQEWDGVDFALGRYAEFLIIEGRFDEALSVTREAISLGTDIPATWANYITIQQALEDDEGVVEATSVLLNLRKPSPYEVLGVLRTALQLAKAGRVDAAVVIATRTRETCLQQGNDSGAWRATGELGHIRELSGDLEGAVSTWREAIAEGSVDEVTFDRLSMTLDKAKDYQGAMTAIDEGLTRGLPANVEERLRKRRLRCEAKLTGGGRTTRDVNAFTVRIGEGYLESIFQRRFKPAVRDIDFRGDVAIVLGATKGESVMSAVDTTSGEELWRRGSLPQLDAAEFAPDGSALGLKRTGRIGAGPTLLSFLSQEAELMGEASIPDAPSELAFSEGIWFVGCRDGALYGYSATGERLWSWWMPGARDSGVPEGSQRPCPYFVVPTPRGAVVSSYAQLFAIDSVGGQMWHTEMPDDGHTTYTVSGMGVGNMPDASMAYGALGLATGAPFEEVKAAYRIKALATHPDRHPDDPEANAKFTAVQQAYEAISSWSLESGGSGFSFSISMGFPPSISKLYPTPDGFVAVSQVGSVYDIDPHGRIRSTRMFGRGYTTLLLSPSGTITAAWCDGTLSWLRDGSVRNAAEMKRPPTGMLLAGDRLLFWQQKRVGLSSGAGESLWEAEFSTTVRAAAASSDRVAIASGVLAGFSLPGA